VDKVLISWRRFKYVFFVDASSEASIKTDLRNAIQSIDGHQQETEEDALHFLQSRVDSLLIFDNADDPNLDLVQFFPNSYNGIIIVTSRLRTLGRFSTLYHLQLGEMSRDEAIETVVKAAGRTLPLEVRDAMALDALVEELGHLALALVQAGVYIFNTGSIETDSSRDSVFGQYLELFRRERALLMRRKGDKSLDNYIRGVYPSLDLSYTLLPQSARQLLHLCSQFHYTTISLAMLLAATKSDFEDSDIFLERPDSHRDVQGKLRELFRPDGILDEIHIREMIQSLSLFSLVQSTLVNETILLRFHPLVHSWAHEMLSVDSLSMYTGMAVTIISTSETCLSRAHIQYLPPHIIQVMRKVDIRVLHARDMMKLGGVMRDHGFGTMGLELHEGAVKKINQEAGSDKMQVIKGYLSLGDTYRAVGRLQEAEEVGAKTLLMCREVLGERHPDTTKASNNLAATYSDLGKLKEAEELQVNVLAMRREVLGERHPDTISASNNLAITYRDLGKLKEAEELQVNVLAMQREVLGERHPHTIMASNNLALTYKDLGKLKEAEELQVNVLAMRREVLGERHPDTISASANLALTYRDLGKLKEAEELQVNVLAMRREVLGERHPDTIMASNNLALTYRDLGKLKEAEELQVNVLAMRREVLGERHPDTISASNNLAITYFNLGKMKEAEELQVNVLTMRREVLGEGHPDTIIAFNNLAITYRDLHRLSQAEELCKKAHELASSVLGENHPDSVWIAKTLSKIQADIEQASQEPAKKRRR
jgi:tetratricopeptide (TPR) repeat protein